jgi:acyl carrier protein
VSEPAGSDESSYRPVGPDLDQVVLAAWRDVLRAEHLAPDDDFFDVGGDSLAAVRIVGRLEEDLRLELSVRLVLETRTRRRMTDRLRELIAQQPG